MRKTNGGTHENGGSRANSSSRSTRPDHRTSIEKCRTHLARGQERSASRLCCSATHPRLTVRKIVWRRSQHGLLSFGRSDSTRGDDRESATPRSVISSCMWAASTSASPDHQLDETSFANLHVSWTWLRSGALFHGSRKVQDRCRSDMIGCPISIMLS